MPATPKVVGLWLCFHATIGLLRRCLWECIFVVLQEAPTLICLFRHIARAWATSIPIRKLSIARSDDDDNRIFYVILQWVSNNDTIFTLYCKGASDDYMVSWGSKRVYIVSWGSERRQHSTIARTRGTVARVWRWRPTMQLSNFYMLLIAMITAMVCWLQEAMTESAGILLF